MSNTLILQPTYWASVSGGKDSLYMLNLILKNQNKYPLHGVVHFELEIDYPFIKNVVDYMEDRCKMIGIPFLRIKPRKSWDSLYNQYGFPSTKCRWGNSNYKLDGVAQLKEWLKTMGKRPVFYIGFCADETKRFRTDENIYPLAVEGIEESFILEWAKETLIFNDFYKIFKRCGCMMCPMQTMKESAYILYKYPEIYNKMIKLAKKTELDYYTKTGRTMSVWNGHAKYDTEYRDKIVKEKWLPRLRKELENGIQ